MGDINLYQFLESIILNMTFSIQDVQDSEQADGTIPLEEKRVIADFILKSHTCSNTLDIPSGSHLIPLPSEKELFRLYDYAFKNAYFGLQ